MAWYVPVRVCDSPIHGRGIVAETAIAKGTKIWQVDRSMQFYRRDDLLAMHPADLLPRLRNGYYHAPTKQLIYYDGDPMTFSNHGGELANYGGNWFEDPFQEQMIALRDIAAGEELLEDYTIFAGPSVSNDQWIEDIFETFAPEAVAFLRSLKAAAEGRADACAEACADT